MSENISVLAVLNSWNAESVNMRSAMNCGQHTAAVAYAQKAVDLAVAHPSLGNERRAVSHFNLGEALFADGDLAEASFQFKIALQVTTQSKDVDPFLVSDIEVKIARSMRLTGEAELAKQKALTALTRIIEAGHPDKTWSEAAAKAELGWCCRDLGHLTTSVDYFLSAIRLLEARYGPLGLELCELYGELAKTQVRLGDHSGARESAQVAIDRAVSLVGEMHPRVATFLTNASEILSHNQQFSEALTYAVQAQSIWMALDLPLEQEFLRSLQELGTVLAGLRRFEDAKFFLTDLLDRLAAKKQADSLPAASAWRSLAWIAREQQRHEEYLHCAKMVCSIVRNVCGTSAPCLVGDLVALGEACLNPATANSRMAVACFRQSVDLARKLKGEDSVYLIPGLMGLSRCFKLHNETDGFNLVEQEIQRIRQISRRT